MKFLKKASLAAAIAAAPFAVNAEMVAMDDATMSSTTGQSGVTIAIDIDSGGITVGGIEYTDTGSGALGGGSVVLQNLKIANVTNLVQTIDVSEEGDLVIGQTGVSGMNITLGDVAGTADNDYSAVAIKGTNGTAELVDSLAINMDLGQSTITIHNMANGDNLGVAAGVTGTHANDLSSLAIEMNSSFKINDLDAQVFGYTSDQAYAKVSDQSGISVADLKAADATSPAAVQQAAGKAKALADGAAITVSNLVFSSDGTATGNAVTMGQVIWADSDGVYVQMGQITGSMTIGDLAIGSNAAGTPLSIGSLAVSDINLNGLTQRISGHD